MLGFTIGRVHGNSMLPRIPPDSFIIASRWPLWLKCSAQIGQMYYINHSRYGRIVKTLDIIDSQQRYWFRGESSESVSREAIGAIEQSAIIGRVIWVVKSSG